MASCAKKLRAIDRSRLALALITLLFLGLAGALLEGAGEEKIIPWTLDWLARDTTETISNKPMRSTWHKDGSLIFFSQMDFSRRAFVIKAVDPRSATIRPASPDEEKALSEDSAVNSGRTLRAVIRDGDLLLEDLVSKKSRFITRTAAVESAPQFLRDGRRIAFLRDGNAYIIDPADGAFVQLTDIRAEAEPARTAAVLSSNDLLLEKEQKVLFPIFAVPGSKPADPSPPHLPRPFYLGGKSRRAETSVSPDGRRVAVAVTDAAALEVDRLPIRPKYVTASGHVEVSTLSQARLKAGSAEARMRIAVYDAETGAVRWPEIDTGQREVNHYFFGWSPDGRRLLFYVGALDLKDLWMAVFDVETGTTAVVNKEHDDVYLRDDRGDVSVYLPGWLDEKTIYFLSERDGWNHLYLCRVEDGKTTQLTSGPWEIDWFRLARDRSKFYFLATKDGPAARPLYAVPSSGGPVVRLTSAAGCYSPIFSPDESRIAFFYSHSQTPHELYVMDNRPGAPMIKLTDTRAAGFSDLGLKKPQFVTFPDNEDFTIHANLFLPPSEKRNRAAIINAHGTGYAQSVKEEWSDSDLVFQYLARQGYVVLDIDFLGSSGYGRAGRVAIHHKIGYRDVDSAVAAKDYLVREQGVDPARVGIIGGSYGGFYTLMALFTRPGVFAAGVALYPCTDWFQYTRRFINRFLGLPAGNEDLYRKCSPIYQAEGLADPLLLFHGLEDGNVFAQDTIRLVQRLIELRKTDWDYHLYPTEGHGWRREDTKLDYYRRMTTFFKKNLLRLVP